MLLQKGTLLQGGRYKIIESLGQGGFGITYLGIQSGLERKVAIKEFFMKELCNRHESTSHVTLGTEGSRHIVQSFREKFLKEARNLAKLNHPNIVRVIDVFEENGTAYYVMEYAENGSLSGKIKEMGCIPEPLAIRYIIQVAEALNYIHHERMNHLDIKPANIMLNKNDECILIDFGLSKQYDAQTGNQTSTTPIGISHGYAPMEQYNEGGVVEFSPETDIYALGATFFKLLTGITPPNASEIMENGIPIWELKKKRISQTAIDVVCLAMQFRKKARLNSASMFINILNNAISFVDEETTTVADETTVLISNLGQNVSSKIQDDSKASNNNQSLASENNVNQSKKKIKTSFLQKWIAIIVAILIPCLITSIFFTYGENEVTSESTEKTEKVANIEFQDKNGVAFTYSGDIIDGKPEGHGTGCYPYGTYTGEYQHGLRQGKGKFESKDGSNKFDGTFESDSYSEGILHSSGMTFKGTFKNEQPYNGTWYDANNKEYAKIKNGQSN